MNPVSYQNLRFAVEEEFTNAFNNPQYDKCARVNSLMRLFLCALAQQEVARQRSVQKFKQSGATLSISRPVGAYRKPGIVPGFQH